MTNPIVEQARRELEQAQAELQSALNAWDTSVSDLWRTSLALTQAQKRVTHAHELLRNALDTLDQAEQRFQ
jgi:exonuclease VII small subunit